LSAEETAGQFDKRAPSCSRQVDWRRSQETAAIDERVALARRQILVVDQDLAQRYVKICSSVVPVRRIPD